MWNSVECAEHRAGTGYGLGISSSDYFLILFINPNIQYLAAHTYERNITLNPKERVLNPFLTLVVGALLGVPHACKTVEALLSMLRLFTNSLFNLFPP